MTVSLNSHTNYLERWHSDTKKRITKTNDIHINLQKMSSLNSKSTIELKLNTFKKIILYARNSITNPTLNFLGNHNLSLSPEMAHIHYKMFKFLTDNNFMTLENEELDTIKFIWNIPLEFTPIFTAYILVSNKLHKMSVEDFFKELDQYMDDYPNLHNDYINWTTLYLGREYFCKLENIFIHWDIQPYDIQKIREQIHPLTEIHLQITGSNIMHGVYATALLDFYIDRLNEIFNEQQSSYTIKSFYMMEEKKYIEQLLGNLSIATHNFYSFYINFQKQYKGNNDFSISIGNFSEWEKQFTELMDTNYRLFEERLQEDVRKFYQGLYSKILPQYEIKPSPYFYICKDNMDKHEEYIIKIFTSCYSDILDEYSKFKRKVKRVSCDNYRDNTNASLKNYTFDKFKNDINGKIEKFYNSLKKKFYELPPYIIYTEDRLLDMYTVPTIIYSEEDSTKIVSILEEKKLITNDYGTLSNITYPIWLPDFFNQL